MDSSTFMLGLWANTFPLRCISQLALGPWTPILLLACLMSSIPTDVPASQDPSGSLYPPGEGGSGAQAWPSAPVHPVKPLTPWQHRNLPCNWPVPTREDMPTVPLDFRPQPRPQSLILE